MCLLPTTTECGACADIGIVVPLCHDKLGCTTTHARNSMKLTFHALPEVPRRRTLTYGQIARVTQVGGHKP